MSIEIWGDEDIFVIREEHENPWVKIFTRKEFCEITDMPLRLRDKIWLSVQIAEIAMREFYNPDKINIASFANMLPRVHFHIQARFKNDAFFPLSLWGQKQRDVKLDLPSFDEFAAFLKAKLEKNI